MQNCFLSVVSVVQNQSDLHTVGKYLEQIHGLLAKNFSDFEILLVNNFKGSNPAEFIEPFDQEVKQNVFLLELATSTSKNHATLAGLDRANGDYTVIFELELWTTPDLIQELYEASQKKYDLVYLRAKEKSIPWFYQLFYWLFYFILRNFSNLKVDAMAFDSRIISRRALNSLLRHRENLRYMKAIYSMVGYNSTYISIDQPLEKMDQESFSEKFRASMVAITSYTSFLRTIMLWTFVFSFLFLCAVVYNAVKVKLTGEDIFGNVGQAIPGWAFLVLLISVFFAVMCLNLYIMSIYLSNIYQEIKQRPLYIIESIKRF